MGAGTRAASRAAAAALAATPTPSRKRKHAEYAATNPPVDNTKLVKSTKHTSARSKSTDTQPAATSKKARAVKPAGAGLEEKRLRRHVIHTL